MRNWAAASAVGELGNDTKVEINCVVVVGQIDASVGRSVGPLVILRVPLCWLIVHQQRPEVRAATQVRRQVRVNNVSGGGERDAATRRQTDRRTDVAATMPPPTRATPANRARGNEGRNNGRKKSARSAAPSVVRFSASERTDAAGRIYGRTPRRWLVDQRGP